MYLIITYKIWLEYKETNMCKLCDEIRPKGWNYCCICGKELKIPTYNLDDTFEDLIKRVTIDYSGDNKVDIMQI